MKKIIIACDSYKGCLSSREVNEAIASGLKVWNADDASSEIKKLSPVDAIPEMKKMNSDDASPEIITLEMSDGGEGMLDAFSSAMCAVSSRTARKSLPPFEEKAPHTFSHTMNLGRTSSPVLPCILSFSLISFTTLI